MNVVIGLDPHKVASNTIAVLDRDEKTCCFVDGSPTATPASKSSWNRPGCFRTESGRSSAPPAWGRTIAQQLVAGGETVTDVPAKLAAQVRVYGPAMVARLTPPTRSRSPRQRCDRNEYDLSRATTGSWR